MNQVTKSPQRISVAAPVKHWRVARQCAKQAIEEEECDAKVLIHESLVVERPMMDVVRVTRRYEPPLQQRVTFHPETGQVHAIVQIAEHQKTPDKCSSHEDELMQQCDPQQVEQCNRTAEK
jgi:hypothetical protein